VSLALLLVAAAHTTAAAKCTCRARGVTATLGQTVCIPTPQGARLARCGMLSNVASWTFLNRACPLASLDLEMNGPSGAKVYPQSARVLR
jgi:hypothetical protein